MLTALCLSFGLLSPRAPTPSGQEPATETPAQAVPAEALVPLAVGDFLPPVEIEGLSQTPASSFSDYYGRVVLLEFFAFWCAPCALSVPHLNKLEQQYGPRGLSVVAVTTESAKKTLPWIEKNGAKYAHGRDVGGVLHRLFQIQTIPSAALIDSFGVVAWIGDPRSLRSDTIEGLLADALPRPVWEWAENERLLVQLLEKGEYAAALQAADVLPAREGFDPVSLVRARFTPLLARFEDLVEEGDYLLAFKLGDRLAKGLGTTPEGEKLGARLSELRSDPEIAKAVEAEERLNELESRFAALRRPVDAETLRKDVAAYLETKPGKEFERRARTLLESLDRGLKKRGGKSQ